MPQISVADPDADPPDPHVFGPPGSGSNGQRYGSGSGPGSFYHHAKIVRKTLIPTILWLFWLFIFKKWCKCPSKSNKQKIFILFSVLLASWRSMTKIAGSGSGFISQSMDLRIWIRIHIKMSWIRNTASNNKKGCHYFWRKSTVVTLIYCISKS